MRKLTAIMFTDIESFTQLMQQDESEAISLLARHKQIYIQHTKQFAGRTVKYLGDGTLTIFPSAIEAVKCGIALQQSFQKAPVIPVRIGIHLGDVIFENKDVIGDAVNFASRIQTAGIAGSVLISEKVKDELINHHEINTVPVGIYHLKNISNPAPLYAIVADGLKVPDTTLLQGSEKKAIHQVTQEKDSFLKAKKKLRTFRIGASLLIILLLSIVLVQLLKNKVNSQISKTIAVLPFENINGEEKDNFLADGLTEELITLLSANPELKIKKVPKEVLQGNTQSVLANIFNQIKVGNVLEGKVQHDKDSLIIFVTLHNISTSEIIWSKTYRRQFKELMKVQESVAAQIAESLNTNFTKEDIQKIAVKRAPDPEAYLLYMQGRYAQNLRTPTSMRDAIFLFKKALQKDTNYALAFSGIGDNYTLLVDNGYIPYDSGAPYAHDALERAFILDSTLPEIRASRAIFMSSLEGKYAESLNDLKLSVKLNPNYAAAQQWYAVELAANSQFDSALAHIDKALELEPLSERKWLLKGLILEFARRYKECLQLLNDFRKQFPENTQYLLQKTECFYWMRQPDSLLQYASLIHNSVNDYEFWKAVINDDKKILQKHLEEKSSLAPLDDETLATYYVFLGQNQKALDCLEDAYSRKEFSWLKFLNVAPMWDPLRKEPQFQNLLLKLGFNKRTKIVA